jgi:hypothetical protein
MVEKIGRQIINDLFLFSSKNRSCCNANDKYKVMNNSNQNVISEHTQVRRNVDTILYSLGGRTQYGFIQPQQVGRIRFLAQRRLERQKRLEIQGRLEGQPGGILGPIKNKF